MIFNQDERRFYRNKPIGTSEIRQIIVRAIYCSKNARDSPLLLSLIDEKAFLRFKISFESTKLLQTQIEKLFLGIPNDYANNYRRIVTNNGNISSFNLFPHELKINKKKKKKRETIDYNQRIHELTQQNEYLLAKLALLRKTRLALKELQERTQKAFWVLKAALNEVCQRTATSEQRLMRSWNTHSDDESEEVTAF